MPASHTRWEGQPAAGRLFDAVQHADQRALACAVGADDGHDLAGGDLERDAVERLGVAIEEVEVFDVQKRAHRTSCSPR
jgi:hypothetical protein